MGKNYLQTIGCGASQGVPTPDGDWGNCKKNKFYICHKKQELAQKMKKIY